MQLFGQGEGATFVVEREAHEGVKRIAVKVADDMCVVSGYRTEIIEHIPREKNSAVLFATLGKSKLLLELQQSNVIKTEAVEGKREVYGVRLLDISKEMREKNKELQQLEQLLVIYGSDKRGTIYGMFHLSELMGVSPLYFWGDAVPNVKTQMCIDKSINMVSKEPSVRYRGFFINDEWPCFGTWTFQHYNGFTAEMYDKIFELLLRLKGNYLWPAMWTSSFALDGPGEENERLADIYGVIMGNSHHEPCLRASEEWDIYRGENSVYGNTWNYVKNKDGLLKYWEDGLVRSGKYENMITVGMRGERDSEMEGPNSLCENIEILKDIITRQKELIKKNVQREEVPMLLAIYKEVEDYYYGDENTPGLREWDGLDDVILMFCEDNFGHMRYLPAKEENHSGGYGMYYHLDYHGDPISYEWINSTPLSAIWEQMTLAYEHGIQDVWMVNVGDLKGNEFPLSYFLELAYDYDTWGSTCINGTQAYTEKWMRTQFGEVVSGEVCTELANIMTKGVALIGRRRPEALSSTTYHPCNEREADRVLGEVNELLIALEKQEKSLPKQCLSAFYSMIYDDLQMGLNLIAMHIYAGKNQHYAKQGKRKANFYEEKVRECIKKDRDLIEIAAKRHGGKWHGMKSGSHIGFQKWNEDGCRYPITMHVEPFHRPRMVVSRADEERILLKNYGKYDTMDIKDFTYAGVKEVLVEIANDGIGTFTVTLQSEPCAWLQMELSNDVVEMQEVLRLQCINELLPKELEKCVVLISDGDTTVQLNVYGRKCIPEDIPFNTFVGCDGIISILAEHYSRAEGFVGTVDEMDHTMGRATVLQDFGLCGSGVKNMAQLLGNGKDMGLVLTYDVYAPKEAQYQIELWSAPSNPLSRGKKYGYKIRNAGMNTKWKDIEIWSENYQAGKAGCREWADGVVEQIHKTTSILDLKQGVNSIEVALLDSNIVLEKILIYLEDIKIKSSCMGPMESYFVRNK